MKRVVSDLCRSGRVSGGDDQRRSPSAATKGLGGRLVVNSGVTAICRVIQAAVMVAAVPVVISKLGLAGYGVWETIVALSASALLLLGPLTGTLLWRGSLAHGSGDPIAMRRTAGVGLTATFVLLVCTLPVFHWAIPLGRVLHVSPGLLPEFRYVMPCVLELTFAMGLVESFGATIDGSQRIAFSSPIRTIGQSIRYGVAIVCLQWGCGLTSLLYGYLASIAVMVVAMAIVAHRICPSVRPIPLLPTRDELVSGGRYAGLLTVGYISAALRDQTDKLVFALFASPIWVGYYAIASRIAWLVMEISQFVYNPTVAAAGALAASDEEHRLAGLYQALMAWVPALSGIILLVVLGLHNQLMVLWLGHIIPQTVPLLLMLVMANALVVALTGPGTSICRGIGRVEIETRYVVFNLLINAIFTVVLVKMIGPMGSAIASVGSWALGSVYFVWQLHRNLSLPVQATMKAVGIYCCSVALGLCTMFLVNRVGPAMASRMQSVAILALGGVGSAIVYVFLLWILKLSPADAPYYLRRGMQAATRGKFRPIPERSMSK